MDSPAHPSPSVFRHRDFALFWWARLFANLALAAESVTIGWQVYDVARRTNSIEQGAFLVGMVGLVQFVPVFALTLTAGETADRYDRRLIMMICAGIEIVAVATLGVLALHPSQTLMPIFIAAAIFGAARAFFTPASSAMGPMLVPRAELPRAVAWNSLAWQGAAILGPALGGLLVAISPSVAFFGAAALYALSVLFLLVIRTNAKPVLQPGSRLALIKEGLGYVWTNKIVLGAISLDLFAVLLGGATALLPVFARDILKVDAEGYGLLRASPAVGAAMVAFYLAKRPLQRNAGRWMFIGVAAFGLATLLFAVSKSIYVSMGALAVLGAADMISVFVRQSLVQIVTPDHMRGRVGAVSGLFIGASNELGEFESGLAAKFLGPIGAALFGGFGSLIVTGVWSRLFPELRKADRLDRPEETPK